MRDVLIGQTDYTVLVRIAGTDGAPETGLAHTDIDIAYARVETDNDVTTTDVAPADLASLTAAHSDWGWEEVSSTDHPGLYRLDIADAVFASGAWEAVVTITDASGTDFYAVDIGFRLVSFNVQDGVRLGLTALPNAAADAAGGLPISDAGGLDLDARLDAAVSSRLAPTTAGRTLDVSAGGEAGLDWANIGSPTTTVGLSGTTVKTATDVETDTQDIQSRLPAALTAGGNMKSDALAVSGSTTAADNAEIVFDTDFAANYDTTRDKWKANVSHINDVAATSVTTINAVIGTSSAITVTSGGVTLANGVTHGGSTAMFRLGSSSSTPAFYATNSAGVPVQFEATAGNASGLVCVGFGTGSGFEGTGGNTGGHGWSCQGGTGGDGLRARGQTTGHGIAAVKGASGNDIDADLVGNFTGDMTVGTLTVTTNSVAWNAAWDAEVQSEVADALDAAVPGSPTSNSINERIKTMDDAYTATRAGYLDNINNSYLATFSASGIRTAVGLASANLDTQLDTLPTAAENFTAVLTTQLTEAYAADGVAPTLAQAIFLVQQSLHEFAISGTTRTVKKLDGSTTAATFTLDSSTAPTSTTRAT